jgi:hypothetical protein
MFATPQPTESESQRERQRQRARDRETERGRGERSDLRIVQISEQVVVSLRGKGQAIFPQIIMGTERLLLC